MNKYSKVKIRKEREEEGNKFLELEVLLGI